MTGAPAAAAAARVVLALGSNLGDRLHNLQGALDALFDTSGLVFVAVSPVYETAPVGGPAQPDYLNAVVLAESRLPAPVILERCHAAERAFGRLRGEVWGPRTLDVDFIVYGDEVSDDPELTLPHPRAHPGSTSTRTASSRDTAAWLPCSRRSAWRECTGGTIPFCSLRYDDRGGVPWRGGA
jgi:2-amino-4-hydroxy-6-hydroxymethyldihydropteridine diphosphokinase